MTPAAAIRHVVDALTARHPELVVLEDLRADLVSTETWGVVLSPDDDLGHAPYRYLLWRIFDDARPLLLVIMLNPSRATHVDGDRTVDGLVRRARRFGYGGVLVANCFAWRATDPVDMRNAAEPVGPCNDHALRLVLALEVDALCAWGTNATHRQREERMRWMIGSGNARPHCLRLCANGAPEHPLYVPGAIAPTPWLDMRVPACPDPTGN